MPCTKKVFFSLFIEKNLSTFIEKKKTTKQRINLLLIFEKTGG
ncbi:hypothetical protein SD77_1495 [Bacillus badius]|uniref:Uncharacterized protein n=1 Tax=Bacillus badius TaxID=1455 RepID=A0ABR5ARX1_BACBA|nr:hypothetical protein SD78_3153 [Bacillus badius]KIL77509.1 hypothetical protein SD77_1495 [Bacillus badius]